MLLYMLGCTTHVQRDLFKSKETYPKRRNVRVGKVAPSLVIHVKRDMSMLDFKKRPTKKVWKETYKSTTKEIYLKKRPTKETWVCDVKKRPFSKRDLQRPLDTSRASRTDKTENLKRDLQKKCKKETYKSTTDLKKSPTKELWTILQGPLSYRLDLDFKKRHTQEMWRRGLQKYYRPQKEPNKRTLDTSRASLVPTRLRLQKVTNTRTLKKRPTIVS